MAVVTTNLGTVTAYGDAVAAGYTGTKEEWQTLMADYAENVPKIEQNSADIADLKGAIDGSVEDYINNWLDSHPEATTTVQDGSINTSKLDNSLKINTLFQLNGLTYSKNIELPVAKSYSEAATYLNGNYFVACRDYSGENTSETYIAKYNNQFELQTYVHTDNTYGVANNMYNDGKRIYVDYDGGYHVSFDENILNDKAIHNPNFFDTAYWDGSFYGIALDPTKVTIYTIESNLTTVISSFGIATTRQTLQSAGIVDGIFIITTTKGLFKFIDLKKKSIVDEIMYNSVKEIENIFQDNGKIACCGHNYGLNGIFNIGWFNNGVDHPILQYVGVDCSEGNFNNFFVNNGRSNVYKITNGTEIGLPYDDGDLIVTDNMKMFVSTAHNSRYFYKSGAWNWAGTISSEFINLSSTYSYRLRLYLLPNGDFTLTCLDFTIEQNQVSISYDLSDIWNRLGYDDSIAFQGYMLGRTSGTGNILQTSDIYIMQYYINKSGATLRFRNLTQNKTTDITAVFNGSSVLETY